MTTQRQQPHPVGTFPNCPGCSTEPRHILDCRRRPLGGHLLSCRCGDSLKHDSLADAVRHWCRMRNVSMTVRPERGNVLALRAPVRNQGTPA